MRQIIVLALLILAGSCRTNKSTEHEIEKPLSAVENQVLVAIPTEKASVFLTDTTFVNLADYSNDFIYDMKYATDDNFLKQKVYDCGECYLRLKTVRAILNASTAFGRLGYKIKIFDCYRPLAVQKQMWSIVNNPKYVADPAKGSIHNRGGAVDITLVDSTGMECDMGTGFDHFGREAAHGYSKISASVREYRILLRKIMEENGFVAFESEWWHYNLAGSAKDPVSNFNWPCN